MLKNLGKVWRRQHELVDCEIRKNLSGNDWVTPTIRFMSRVQISVLKMEMEKKKKKTQGIKIMCSYSMDHCSFHKLLSLEDYLFSFSYPSFLTKHLSQLVVWDIEICLFSAVRVTVLKKTFGTFLKCFLMAKSLEFSGYFSFYRCCQLPTRHVTLIMSLNLSQHCYLMVERSIRGRG